MAVATSTPASSEVLIDVTDLVEFASRGESVSGVQRVIAETAPLLVDSIAARCVFLDRPRGQFILLDHSEIAVLVHQGARAQSNVDRDSFARAALATLQRGHGASPITIDSGTTLVFLGALWINDALMIAARTAQSRGARIVSLLYDLTPVMQAGHTAAVNRLFDRYLTLLCQTGSRVPAISRSSRRDFEGWATEHDFTAPAGEATGLPCGLSPEGRDLSQPPWPRPYALFVGTIEARKNHLMALRTWQQLIERHGADQVPDLVCIGRLGWHAGQFLREYVASNGANGKVSILTASVGDETLARFYAHSQFTIYPSSYEGWGLPVSESLEFGKVPVVADNSSLREAGGDVSVYFPTGDVDALVHAIETNLLDEGRRQELTERIRTGSRESVTWKDVSSTIAREIELAEGRDPVFAQIELGREYMLAVGATPPDEGYADRYLDHLMREGLTPMLRQPRGDDDFAVADAAVTGAVGSPQTWGYEIHPGRIVEFRVIRPADGDLVLLVASRAMPGKASVQIAGPGGPVFEEVYLGSVITIPLGDGRAGEHAMASLTVTDATDSVEGFLGIRSFVVLAAADKDDQIIALRSAAQALREELDFLQGTRSWKVTAPLRKWKGRGA